MPTFFRLLLVLGVLAVVVYGGMVALVTYLTPQQRDITQPVTLPPSKK